MRQRTQKGRILALLLTFLMTINLMSPVAFAADTAPKKAVASPLVIMMNYRDYRFEDLDKKEEDGWRLRGFDAKDYTRDYVQNYLFGEGTYKEGDNEYMTIRNYFNTVSGGTFDFNGQVVGPYNATHKAKVYGENDPDWWDSDQLNAMYLVEEAITQAAKDLDLSKFDLNTRKPGKGNGIYGESDDVIDTVIIIHPGRGEEWGNSLDVYDENNKKIEGNAIWPFRCGFTWYDETKNDKTGKYDKDGYYLVKDKTGKEYKVDDFVLIGQDSAIDIIIHEYGHVLDLPDLYGWNSPIEYWDMMGGSYTGPDIPGSMPISFGAYGREFLQKSFESKGATDAKWANLKTVQGFKNSITSSSGIDSDGIDFELHQAHERLGNGTDLIRIDLPDKITTIVEPSSGNYAYFSGNRNNSKASMKTNLDLTEYSEVNLDFKAWYDIDPYFDFATIRVSKSNENEFVTVKGNITTEKFDEWLMKNETEEQRRERNPGHGITDTSGGKWVDAKFDLSDYAGQNIDLTFYFWTDGNTPGNGIFIDDILITGATSPGAIKGEIILEDDAEGDPKFVLSDGFQISDGMSRTGHYYLLEWRNIEEGKVDEGLSHVMTYWNQISYEPGLLVWYINEKYAGDGKPDQNAYYHPGEVFAGIIDSDIEPITWKDEPDTRLDMNMRDAAFGLRLESVFEYDWGDGAKSNDPHQSLVPDFNDSKSYTQAGIDYNGNDYYMGLDLTDYGVKVLVTEEKADRSSAKIHIMDSNIKNNPVNYSDGLNVKNIEIVDNSIFVTADNNSTFDLADNAYIGYISGTTEIHEKLELQSEQEGVYKCSTDFISDAPAGNYEVNFIILEDREGNARAIYNSEVHSGYGMDLSNANIEQFAVIYEANGGNGTMKSDTVFAGEDCKISSNTFTYSKHNFIGWNTEADGSGTSYNNNEIIENVDSNITLYAQWKKVSTSKPSNPDTKDNEDNNEIDKPDEENTNNNVDISNFVDLQTHWARNSIKYVIERGLFKGTSENTFSPNTTMTRGMFVTVLGRLSGENISMYNNGRFNDVDANKYYAEYVEWAAKKGIVKGISNTEFAPDSLVTREQMAVMIVNYINIMGYELPELNQAYDFTDAEKINDWAKEAVKTLVQANIINGKPNNLFDPQGKATRAEASVILHRFLELINE